MGDDAERGAHVRELLRRDPAATQLPHATRQALAEDAEACLRGESLIQIACAPIETNSAWIDSSSSSSGDDDSETTHSDALQWWRFQSQLCSALQTGPECRLAAMQTLRTEAIIAVNAMMAA